LRGCASAVRLLVIVLALTAAVLACSAGADSGRVRTLTVFAASSLTEAFTDVAAAFEEAHPRTSVRLNFSGSQRLRMQLEHGAGADIFASADQRHMDLARDSGLVSGEARKFASNTLVIVVPNTDMRHARGRRSSSADTAFSEGSQLVGSPADLARMGVKLVMAQPQVPAGSYAREIIQRMAQIPGFGPAYAQQVLENVVSQEPNVRGVLHKVVLGEVDAGIVYASDAQGATNITVIPIPAEANVVATYEVAMLRDSENRDVAEAFISFVLSAAGQAVLRGHGLGPPVVSGHPAGGRD